MNMKCAICGSDKFHVDVDRQILSCINCSFYCDFKALVRGSAAPQPQSPAYNPADFEIVGGVLKEYKGAAVNVVVPDGVIEIGGKAFYQLQHLETVRLPKGVKIIGWQAFSFCRNLRAVELPVTLEEIGPEAFSFCDRLKDISLPSGLKVIHREAFSCCKSLETIAIPDSVVQIEQSSIHWYSGTRDVNHCFNYCDSLLNITYPQNRFTVHNFYGSLYHRRNPAGQKELLREKKCPDCLGELGMFKKCKKCGKSW